MSGDEGQRLLRGVSANAEHKDQRQPDGPSTREGRKDVPLLVINPASSKGKTGRLLSPLLDSVSQVLGEVDTALSLGPGDSFRLAQEAAKQGRRRIIAVGGDGTISEVCAGVVESGANSAVGLIHQGTGGDFRRSLGLEHRLDKYLEVIAQGRTKLIDIGEATFVGLDGEPCRRVFVNVASLGMGGLVDRYVSDFSSALGGKAAYFAASLRALAAGKAARLKLRCVVSDREETEGGELEGDEKSLRLQTRNISICNGRWFGGGMKIAPDAALDDGLFDVVALGGSERLPVLALASSLYEGKHLQRPNMFFERCSELEITPESGQDLENFLLDLDGECVGHAPVTFRTLPSALKVLVP